VGRWTVPRRLLWLAAAALLVLLLVVAPFDRTEPAPEAVADTAPPVTNAALVIDDGPPRGSLAQDEAFVAAVRRLPWTADEAGDAALGIRTVVFAGDVPGARWALVVGQVLGPPLAPGSPADGLAGQTGLLAVWFGGRSGAPVDELRPLTAPTRAPADAPLGLLDQRTGTLVVVAAPGDVVEVSERPEVVEDGRVYRSFREVETVDGVAVARLRPSDVPVSAAAAFRVIRNGRLVAHAAPTTVGGRPGAALPVALDHADRPLPAGAGPVVALTAERLLAPLGLARHELQVTVLWAGPLPGPGPETGSAAVVAATTPSGAVVVDGEWLVSVDSADGSYLQGGDCGLDTLPAGPPVEQRVHALGCEVVDPTTGTNFVRTILLVVAPPDVDRVRLYDNASHFLSELPAEHGVVIAPMPRLTATVEAVTATGISFGRTQLMRRGVDYLD
jgi:hypothetical protein